MEQVTHFTNFLTERVNLPESKLEFLDKRVDLIYSALKNSDLGARVLGMKKQGSWAQRTIINPKEGEEFDADFMIEFEEQDGWSPSDYQTPVFDALSEYCEAQKMNTLPEAKNRCVTVTYANFMHVDVVPYVNRAVDGECIVNTDTNTWEDTDPSGFTKWMRKKDEIANGNMRRALRILKYLRDHRDYYEDTKSIILTTIVGGVISLDKTRTYPGCYDNLPKTLHRITADLAAWVRDMPERPEIADPSRADSTFTHRWPQPEYDNFRRDIQDVAARVEEAINCSTAWSDSTNKWRELLGDGFGPADIGNESKFPATGTGVAAGIETMTGRSGRAG
ncbi:SMODS domain-containing nucleotidyltransferase [Promicromonospora iranensis]|uniref:SMODS domain-containing nucleotidyltransferase n=1 Tax=Promicromonospora iranensis TaxID=1105144 RepID=UPI0023A92209|nr:nucleotidyltransferase [Promicromonospora iranensis]